MAQLSVSVSLTDLDEHFNTTNGSGSLLARVCLLCSLGTIEHFQRICSGIRFKT